MGRLILFYQKTVVDKQEQRNQERLKRREEREKEEQLKKRWVQTFKMLHGISFVYFIYKCDFVLCLFLRTRSRSREQKRWEHCLKHLSTFETSCSDEKFLFVTPRCFLSFSSGPVLVTAGGGAPAPHHETSAAPAPGRGRGGTAAAPAPAAEANVTATSRAPDTS